MSEVMDLLAEVTEMLARKDETYALIADSKPDENCQCLACRRVRGCDGCDGSGQVLDSTSSTGFRLCTFCN